MGNRKIVFDSRHGQRTSLPSGTGHPPADSIRTRAAFEGTGLWSIHLHPGPKQRDNFTSPYWLVTEFNSFLNTDIKFVKGEIMKHLFSKIQLTWDMNSREDFILMVPIQSFTLVSSPKPKVYRPYFVKRGVKPKEYQWYRRNRKVAPFYIWEKLWSKFY